MTFSLLNFMKELMIVGMMNADDQTFIIHLIIRKMEVFTEF